MEHVKPNILSKIILLFISFSFLFAAGVIFLMEKERIKIESDNQPEIEIEIEIGQTWIWKNDNPFDKKERTYKVINTSKNYVQYTNIHGDTISSSKFLFRADATLINTNNN